MQLLVAKLCEQQELTIHQQVNQFFYMQKIEELKMLMDQFDDLNRNLNGLAAKIQDSSLACFAQWRKDARWLNNRKRTPRPRSIL